jgi:hypothetical protein
MKAVAQSFCIISDAGLTSGSIDKEVAVYSAHVEARISAARWPRVTEKGRPRNGLVGAAPIVQALPIFVGLVHVCLIIDWKTI